MLANAGGSEIITVILSAAKDLAMTRSFAALRMTTGVYVRHALALARRSEQKPMKRRTSARLWRIAMACANIRHRPSQQAKTRIGKTLMPPTFVAMKEFAASAILSVLSTDITHAFAQ